MPPTSVWNRNRQHAKPLRSGRGSDTMDEAPREPVMVWQFVRRHFVRIVIGAVLVAVVSTIVFVWMPYRREQRVARKVEAHGGAVAFDYVGPSWVPPALEDRLPIWNRVGVVILDNQAAPLPPDLIAELETLTNPFHLILDNSEYTDAGLEPLGRLKVLYRLDLKKCRITNAGLEHLKGLTNLEFLDLTETETLPDGRDMLRKALPNCNIEPNP